jgi:hypothetical protein
MSSEDMQTHELRHHIGAMEHEVIFRSICILVLVAVLVSVPVIAVHFPGMSANLICATSAFAGILLLYIFHLGKRLVVVSNQVLSAKDAYSKRVELQERLAQYAVRVHSCSPEVLPVMQAEILGALIYLEVKKRYPVLLVLVELHDNKHPQWYMEGFKEAHRNAVAESRRSVTEEAVPNEGLAAYLTYRGNFLKELEDAPTGMLLGLGKKLLRASLFEEREGDRGVDNDDAPLPGVLQENC